MSARRIPRVNAALAVMSMLISSDDLKNGSIVVSLDQPTTGTDEYPLAVPVQFMNANPRHDVGRGKRGGNGKGRQWWNKQ